MHTWYGVHDPRATYPGLPYTQWPPAAARALGSPLRFQLPILGHLGACQSLDKSQSRGTWHPKIAGYHVNLATLASIWPGDTRTVNYTVLVRQVHTVVVSLPLSQ